MDVDRTLCYRALQSRDARFDGRFFTCVKTTGIYCRPVCPARTPLEKNVVFVASAAAAQNLGFRPCLRCRPECAPGAPAWRGTGAVAARALKLIEDGALDHAGVDQLAARTGLGARHLRRLVHQYTGASPIELARTRRILFAKRLIAETPLKITEIAYSSGFRSLRRFNAEMLAALGRAPRDLRKDDKRFEAGPALVLPLSYRPPYDWEGVLAFLRLRAIPGLETVTDHSYARSFVIGEAKGRYVVTHEPARRTLIARIEIDKLSWLDRVVARIRSQFDLDADPQAIADALAGDGPITNRMSAAPGLRVVQYLDPFECGLRAIIGQQVSVKGAVTLLGRIVAQAGGVMPTPAMLLEMDLGAIGLTGARIATIRTWAAFAGQPGALDALRFDLDAAVATVTALPGIGDWTAHYLCLRGLAHTDAFPAGDLVLRQTAGLPAPALLARAEAWRPWRAYAAQALWRFPKSFDDERIAA